jgi:predicted Zn-dependent protease with MMP-like domain
MNDSGWDDLVQRAEAEIERTLASLPSDLAEQVSLLPVIFEPEPNQALVRDGLQPDTLGLFAGERHPDAESGFDPLPGQMILFLQNLWLYAGGDPREFREEVRRTYLHELGHYLGLEEDELLDRGLE